MSVSVEPVSGFRHVWSLNRPMRRHASALVSCLSFLSILRGCKGRHWKHISNEICDSSGTRLGLLRPRGPGVKGHPLIMKAAAPHKYSVITGSHRNSKTLMSQCNNGLYSSICVQARALRGWTLSYCCSAPSSCSWQLLLPEPPITGSASLLRT